MPIKNSLKNLPMLKKIFVLALQKMEYGSALSMKLVKLTGKHIHDIHPKHLIKNRIWFDNYLKKDDMVLDLGCGIGQTSIRISSKVKKIVGLDNDPKSIKIAKAGAVIKKTSNVRFSIADANKKLPFHDKHFTKVIASDVLEHLTRRDQALAEIKRVLTSKGMLFLVVDNPDTSWKKLQKSVGLFYYADSDHKYEYPKEEILSILKSKGFKVLNTSTVTYDTPFKGLIDLSGGLSLSLYKSLRQWRESMNKKCPNETTGYKIIAQKIL